MGHRSALGTLLALSSLALAACADEPTQPNIVPLEPLAAPELAVASDSWLTRADMWSVERWDLTAATVPNAAGQSIVYAIGGRSASGGPLGKVMAYNVVTNAWTVKASLPVPLWGMNQAAVLAGKIYVSGGCSQKACNYTPPSDQLYVYDPAANTWTGKAAMPGIRDPSGELLFSGMYGPTGVIGGKLYTLSSCNYGDAPYFVSCDPSLFFRYNRLTDQWSALPRPSRSYSAGGVIDQKFYAVGGTRVEVYDPVTNRWTIRPPLTTPLGGSAVVMLGKLYTFSGSRLTVYDPVTNTATIMGSEIPTGDSLPGYRPARPATTRVFLNGQPRIEAVGGARPGNNLQYVP
ncbi:MAG TPA: kelch repeat-containing protein [Gemmatimonadales bacterium]